MTPKEYAISLGLAKPGKGRMSLEAHAAINAAKANGMVFDVPGPAQTTRAPKPVSVAYSAPEGVSTAPAEYAFGANAIGPFAGRRWKGIDAKGNTVYADDRQVCCDCGYSLSHHSCDNPSTSSISAYGIVKLEMLPI